MEPDTQEQQEVEAPSQFRKLLIGMTFAGIISAVGASIFWISGEMKPEAAEWFFVSVGIAGACFPRDWFFTDPDLANLPEPQVFFNSARLATVLSALTIMMGFMIAANHW